MARTKLQTSYYNERRRIMNFMRQAEKRGYEFKEGILPKIPKTITAGSVRRLSKLTPTELYKNAVYHYDGKEVSGIRGRDIERAEAAKKAAQTRKKRVKPDKKPKELTEEEKREQEYQEFLKARKKQDQLDLKKLKGQKEKWSERALVEDGFGNLLEAIRSSGHPKTADFFVKMLENQVEKYGSEAVYNSISKMPMEDIIEAAYIVYYNPNGSGVTAYYSKLLHAITGEIPTSQELQKLYDRVSQDEWEEDIEATG